MRRTGGWRFGLLLLASSCSGTGPTPWEMDPDEMQARSAAANAIGPHHESLHAMVGEFTAETRTWFAPDAEPVAGTARLTNQMVLGGKFLQSDLTSEFGGVEFTALGLMGYDSTRGHYQAWWADSMGTYLLPLSTGTRSNDGKVFTMVRRTTDVISGLPVVHREVTTLVDADHMRFEVFLRYPDHAEYKAVEANYTRVR